MKVSPRAVVMKTVIVLGVGVLRFRFHCAVATAFARNDRCLTHHHLVNETGLCYLGDVTTIPRAERSVPGVFAS